MNRLDTLMSLATQARAFAPTPSNRVGSTWFRIATAYSGPRDAATPINTDVYLYDVIGDFGVTAGDFVNELNQVNTKTINLHINSPGGSVFDGIAIHAALVNHPATVNVMVDGIAASAASFIAMAGDTRGIEKPASMMIHDASGIVLGNAKDMRDMADLLDTMSDTIAGIYADRVGGTVADWRDSMRAETWFTSAQAVAAGLADHVLNDTEPAPEDRRSQLIRARARVTLKG